MTKEEIDEALSQEISKRYNWIKHQVKTNIAKGGMNDYSDDLLHHIILDLYKKTPEYKLNLLQNEKVENWILVACGFQLRSGSSPFYREHRRHKLQSRSGAMPEIIVEDVDGKDEMYLCLIQAIEKLDVYKKTIIQKKFFDNWTYDQISEHYQISKTHLIRDTKKAVKEIRQYCNTILEL
jgi:RNA polymerase sigma factor (sigma-70 family)